MDIEKNIEYARSLSYKDMRKRYKEYLQSKELGPNSIGTVTGDTFYLWNNGDKNIFWNAVLADDFDNVARSALKDALTKNTKGNVEARVGDYLSTLRRFRAFVKTVPLAIPEKDDETALKDFLLDIECLDPLDEWTSSFNMFDILKISRTEIRHSNMLSWLLNPNENHGLGDLIIRGFVQYVVSAFPNDTDVFSTLLMDFHDFTVQREWHHIDVLAVSRDEKFVMCIENKIDSGEHDNQLDRYRTIVEETYPDYRKMFVYLSPEGYESSDSDNWCSMGYQDVLTIIENAKRKTKLLPDAELLINNYVETIRRTIVGDEKLSKICAEIYSKHQKALDLIFENKPDKALNLAEILKAWAIEKTEAGEIEVVLDKTNKTYTRFKTKKMSEILPDSSTSISGWKTANYYFFEIVNNQGNEFYIQFALNAKDIPADLLAICERINVFYPSKKQKTDWQWRAPWSTKHSRVDDELPEDTIYAQLDKLLEKVKAFEDDLSKKLDTV